MSGVHSAPMSDHLVRVEALRRLQRERDWTDAELARQCGRTPQQVRSWFVYPSKDGRQIGERLARSLEEVLKLPRYSLDQRPGSPSTFDSREGGPRRGAATSANQEVAAAQQGTPVPVLRWDQLSAMLQLSNGTLSGSAPLLDTFAPTSKAAKFVSMPDDSMAPTFQPGDHVLVDPALAPRAGDTVLIRLNSGEHFLRTFRPRTATVWEGAPLNENYEALRSQVDGAEIVAVMVEHRRYRAR